MNAKPKNLDGLQVEALRRALLLLAMRLDRVRLKGGPEVMRILAMTGQEFNRIQEAWDILREPHEPRFEFGHADNSAKRRVELLEDFAENVPITGAVHMAVDLARLRRNR